MSKLMRLPTISHSSFERLSGLLCLLAFSATTQADLATALNGKVSVDVNYVTGQSLATDIAFAGDGRAVITRKSGQIAIRQVDGTIVTVAYPFGGTLDSASEKGLLGVVADPAVATNNKFYFYVSNGPTNDKHRVYSAVLTASNSFTVNPTPVVAAGPGLPGLEGPANHDGGGMFIYQGKLFIGVGDTGSNATPPVNKYGSCLNKGNGKVLRVNLDGSVPSDNPLVGVASVTACTSTLGAFSTAAPDPRIYAWGFRNPWRIWVDPNTGLLWTGDVGESSSEEISIGGSGLHFGYPFVEGDVTWGNVGGLNCTSMTPSRACTAPAFAYNHGVGSAVTGGLVLDTPAWIAALGSTQYVFGDSSANWLRTLPVNGSRTGFTSNTLTDFASYPGASPVSFRVGPDNSLYVVMLGAAAVYRFTPIAPCPACVAGVQVPALPAPLLLLLAASVTLIGVRLARR